MPSQLLADPPPPVETVTPAASPRRGLLQLARGDAEFRAVVPLRWRFLHWWACASFAFGLAASTTLSTHRIWGLCAGAGYSVAAVAAHRTGSARGRVSVVAGLAGAVVLPLTVLLLTGGAQSEVRVVEHAGSLLLADGAPYVEHAAGVQDYNPYLPGMALFGLPHAVLGSGPLADARLWFAAVFLGCLVLAAGGCGGGRWVAAGRRLWDLAARCGAGSRAAVRMRGSGARRSAPAARKSVSGGMRTSVPAAHAASLAAFPAVALPLAVGGVDLPIVGLMCLALALTGRGSGTATGLAMGAAAALKWTAWPLLPVALVLLAATGGRRAAVRAGWTALLVAGAAVVPSALIQPQAFYEQVVLFPLGAGGAHSPATSPLPGYLLATYVPGGRALAVTALALSAVAIAVSLFVRRPRTVRAAADRLALGLGLAMCLIPATRFGYLIYPLVLMAWCRLNGGREAHPALTPWSRPGGNRKVLPAPPPPTRSAPAAPNAPRLTLPPRARSSVTGMRISELARRAGVTTKALRYYESLGLITPTRLANGYRDYAEDDVPLVREIKALHGLGIPVERTRPFLECLAAGRQYADDCPASLATYREAIDELTDRIEALASRRAKLITNLNVAAGRNVTAGKADDYLTLPPDLPVPEDDGAAAHLPGTPMPPLTLTDTAGRAVRLDALGPRRTVLYVYPLTGRPGTDLPEGWNSIPGARGCTPESCGFRDHFQDLLEAGAGRVYGLSSQDTDYQREVTDRLGLPYDMLSDPALHLADTLRLPTFEAGGARLFARLTLIVREGVIEHVFHPVFPPDRHAEQVLEWLRAHPQHPQHPRHPPQRTSG